MTFSLTEFVQSARSAAAHTRPVSAVKSLMSRTFVDPQAISNAIGSSISVDDCLMKITRSRFTGFVLNQMSWCLPTIIRCRHFLEFMRDQRLICFIDSQSQVSWN